MLYKLYIVTKKGNTTKGIGKKYTPLKNKIKIKDNNQEFICYLFYVVVLSIISIKLKVLFQLFIRLIFHIIFIIYAIQEYQRTRNISNIGSSSFSSYGCIETNIYFSDAQLNKEEVVKMINVRSWLWIMSKLKIYLFLFMSGGQILF